MRRWIIDTNCLLALCLLLVLPAGCTDESLGGKGGAMGKTVMVSLEACLQPGIVAGSGMKQVEPVSRSGQSRPGNAADAPFTVGLEPTQPVVSTRASEGTTRLHNLWLFQFDASGNINGSPQQLTNEVTAINDRVTLEVPLVVSTNQTLYLLALGPKLSHDFSQVKTLAELENTRIEYLTDQGGTAESLITSDAEMPLAGQVTGVTVRDIDQGKQGLVEYNTPAGFTGGIELRSLMARITLRYHFAVDNYRLQGFRLLNVSKAIRLKNPEKDTETADAYEVLESVSLGETDATGLRSQTWYVAQNRRGTVSTILTEDKRYYKVSGSIASGAAPPLGTQIEAWAYSTANADEYAIYQMYVGNNNTDNFDVEPNHFYNLRTTINTELGSAKADERIRAYSAKQSINFRASAIERGTAGDYDKPNITYDLDAHCDTRPITITAHGSTVSVGVYTDPGATQQASADSWLRLSPSPNYTEAYNNTRNPLGTLQTAKTILPTTLKFYLYSDEYIYQDDGVTLPDPGTDGTAGKRSLYIKIATAVEGEAGTTEKFTIYRMDQRPAVYCGCFGGEKLNGAYTQGLLCEQIRENVNKYSEDMGLRYIYPGYYGMNLGTIAPGYGTTDLDNGKTATRKLSENPDGLSLGLSKVADMQKDGSGNILLYQYQNSNTIAARACYDLNRDENGNGRIDDNELIWYLPASNQLIGVYIGNYIDNVKSSVGVSTTERSGNYYFNRLSANALAYGSKSGTEGRLCVRDIPLPSSSQGKEQQVEVYTDGRSNKYAAVHLNGMPRNTENRNENAAFYTKVQLYEDDGGLTPSKDETGADVYVDRITRHQTNSTGINGPDQSLSRYFILSPGPVNSDGTSPATATTMSWAVANGYLSTANTQSFTPIPPSASARQTGCSAYRGKDGQDAPGTWRVPTHREGAIILALKKELEATMDEGTDFAPFLVKNKATNYWLATEFYGNNDAWYMSFNTTETDYMLERKSKTSTTSFYLRCIRDIPDTP